MASVAPGLGLEGIVKDYIDSAQGYSCFEYPRLRLLEDRLRPLGMGVCFMAEYFLPDMSSPAAPECEYELRLMYPEDFSQLYLPEWSNALCAVRRESDVLAVGAFDGGRLIGLAGASAECETMYEIGVDVLPCYRRRGVASAVTSRLALEIERLGKVAFYRCAWSNIASARNAIRSGFRPAWVQLTVKTDEFIDGLNKPRE